MNVKYTCMFYNKRFLFFISYYYSNEENVTREDLFQDEKDREWSFLNENAFKYKMRNDSFN